jgi:16S rRNA (guanine966-N2)-methyltransferase
MRIIAGLAKGKLLNSPPARTRPTSDRAKEGLFSSLESEFGSIEELCVLDLFAGSGAVGVEALSRGAKLVHAVEKDVVTSDVAISNFRMVKNASGDFHLFKMSALAYVESPRAVGYDIIFMDPPYEVENESIEQMLAAIHKNHLLLPGGLIAIERASKGNPFTWPRPFIAEKIRSYGQGSIFYGVDSASVLP